jgi:hypothetical protein
MNFIRVCRICDKSGVCSSVLSETQFYLRNKEKGVFYTHCKECQKTSSKTRSSNIKKLQDISGTLTHISTDTLIDRIKQKILNEAKFVNVNRMRILLDDLEILEHERDIESKISDSQSMHFLKKDLGLNFENPTHISKIKEALSQEYSDIDIINPADVYVFDRQDHIKILVDGGCSFDIDQQLHAKNLIISVLKTNTSNPQPVDRSALFADIRAITIGFTYFILSPTQYDHGNHKVKIGYTHNLKQRITEGQTFNAEDLTVYACIESRHYKNIETYLHKACVHRHVRGEWFNLTLEEIDTIVRDFTRLEGIWNKFLQVRTTPSLVDPLFLSMEEEIALLKRELAKVKSSKM